MSRAQIATAKVVFHFITYDAADEEDRPRGLRVPPTPRRRRRAFRSNNHAALTFSPRQFISVSRRSGRQGRAVDESPIGHHAFLCPFPPPLIAIFAYHIMHQMYAIQPGHYIAGTAYLIDKIVSFAGHVKFLVQRRIVYAPTSNTAGDTGTARRKAWRDALRPDDIICHMQPSTQ